MKSVVVVGAQWGDEGKGKVVDYLAASFDYIARVAGGHNAGHTVIIGKDRYVLQLIPCGILRPGRHAVIGAGVVVDPAALVGEIQTLEKAGIDVRGRLHISKRAHLISLITGSSIARRKRRGAPTKSEQLRAGSAPPTKTKWRGAGSACAIWRTQPSFARRPRAWWRKKTAWRAERTARIWILRARWKRH